MLFKNKKDMVFQMFNEDYSFFPTGEEIL